MNSHHSISQMKAPIVYQHTQAQTNANFQTIRYSLLRLRLPNASESIFEICIRKGSECVVALLPTSVSKSEAEEIYRKIHQGTVTPCTLQEIMEDIFG